ncbi:MAG: (2Fe-2S)-binding protein [Alphaproteobacteria bacterium]|nr:(2Fe-2S)-binding protein [Alphaproteobacteria bacterium]NET91600.1 (2Fe-2S)-binding protein [Kamptonema sp. SIO1D9]
MYVCICNGHRDRDLEQAARQGYRTVDEAYAFLGGLPDCAQCVSFAQDLLDDAHDRLSTETRQLEAV